jgi:hypothetical protein
VAACAAGLQVAPLPAERAATGPLTYLGGLHVSGPAPFGGWSGLHLAPDLICHVVTDLGRWARFRLRRDAAGAPSGISDYAEGPLLDGAGAPLRRPLANDAEALARLPDGTWLVSFERWHRIRAHPRLDGPGRYVAAPPGLDGAPYNAGLETLAVLADGTWFALTEDMPAAGPRRAVRGWVGRPDSWRPLAYPIEEPWCPVDATALPDGGVLVLERQFTLLGGFAGRIRRLAPGTWDRPEPFAALDPPLPQDNWEGISLVVAGSETLLAVVSDDNGRSWQRTLLLLFKVAD